jgi:hypothetical protein
MGYLDMGDRCNELGILSFQAAFASGDTLYNSQDKEICTLDTTGIIHGADYTTPCINGFFNNRLYWLNGLTEGFIGNYPNYQPTWSDRVHYAANGSCLVRSALPGCYVKDGLHAGTISVSYDGNEYYACFNTSTGKWETTLPV